MNLEFPTKRLQLAIYLHASGLLPFLRTEPNGDGKVRFVFQDADRKGSQFELDFDRGATVCARDIFSSQTFLRRQMNDAFENRKTGGRSDHTSPEHR
jgi:hypothetical protein